MAKTSKKLLSFCNTMIKASDQYNHLTAADKAQLERHFIRFMEEVNKCRSDHANDNMLHHDKYDHLVWLTAHFPLLVKYPGGEQ